VLPLLAALTWSSGCSKATPAGTGPFAALIADAVPRIEAQLGLRYTTPPTLATRSKAEVSAFLMRQLTSERAVAMMTGQQALYRVLGLIPDTMQLGGLMQRLLEEQVVGYYDPKTKVLYVVDGAPKALVQQTVTHELVHALQDQHLNLDSVQAQTDDADRQSTVQAVLEGQAVFTQLLLDPGTGPMMKMPGGWDRIRDLIRNGQTGMPVFASAPRIIREGLLYPYLGGADFVRRYQEQRPMASLLTDLPVSSMQLLNDGAYFTATPAARPVPTAVTMPAPVAGTVVYTNTLGEFETRLALVQHVQDESLARRGAGGLAGDRVTVVRTPQGDAVVWASAWTTSVDAADFLEILADAARRRYEMAKPEVPPGATTRRLDVSASKRHAARTVTLSLLQRDGQPVVLFTDVPAGVNPALIDAARLTLRR
jgi:hypothetical protein